MTNRLSWALLAGCLTLIGCAGATEQVVVSPYIGTWTGTHDAIQGATTLDAGKLSFEVLPDGTLTGTISRGSPKETVTLVGSIQADGVITLTYPFSGPIQTAHGPTALAGSRLTSAGPNGRIPITDEIGDRGELRFTVDRI